MTGFPLKIVTADGLIFDGTAEKLIVRTGSGDMAVLAHHINCVCPLGMGRAVVESEGTRRTAACIGGMLSVNNGTATLVPTTFEWADEIDLPRAKAAQEQAEALLRDAADAQQQSLAKAMLRRALVRQSVARGE